MRRSRVITAPDQARLVRTLESSASDGNFFALRTRAILYLLWDGAVRTKVAQFLNAEEVVRDPGAARITIVRKVTQRPCEANHDEGRSFVLDDRARRALGDYLRAARREGWLPTDRVEGPLFLLRWQRVHISDQILQLSWKRVREHARLSRVYRLDDVVHTGRVAFLAAAGGDREALSQHAGISLNAAAAYRWGPEPSSPAQVLAILDKQQRADAKNASR